jgi:tetratricopeptide (TPR) repeat protein
MKKVFAVLAIALMAFTNAQSQQLKTPAPSPLATLKQAFGLSDISIEYSRPSAKGRVVYGDVVPFGQIWRTGANGATTITFGEDVFVEGKAVAAGTYALYSMPKKDSWTIMLYKDTKLGGNVGEYKQENELLRFDVKPTQVSPKVETFTINIADQTATTANIELVWENTRVAFGIKVEVDEKIMKNIENVMIKDTKPYYTAARYYYDNNKDLKQALEWATKATEMNPSAYWVFMLKGNIQFKMGDKKGAAETAKKVIELAKADGDDAYLKMGEKLLMESK